jgi:hypothetical protein
MKFAFLLFIAIYIHKGKEKDLKSPWLDNI